MGTILLEGWKLYRVLERSNMKQGISYITPAYGFDDQITHIGAPENAREKLQHMGDDIAGTPQLVAVYIPLGTDAAYQVGNEALGRVVGTVKLLPMPEGKTINDYTYKDLDGTLRWPVGWPCKAVHAPEVSECPSLRSIVDMVHGFDSFQPYTSQFQHGPFKLDLKVKQQIETWFDREAV